jgi:hypothetical protein
MNETLLREAERLLSTLTQEQIRAMAIAGIAQLVVDRKALAKSAGLVSVEKGLEAYCGKILAAQRLASRVFVNGLEI